MPNGSLRKLSAHNHREFKTINRLVGSERVADIPNPLPVKQVPHHRLRAVQPAPAPGQPPPAHIPLEVVLDRDDAGSSNIGDDFKAYVRSGGQRPARNMFPAALAHIRQGEQAWTWQNNPGPPIRGHHQVGPVHPPMLPRAWNHLSPKRSRG